MPSAELQGTAVRAVVPDCEEGDGVTTRAQIIKQCHDILMDVIGLIEVKTDSDAGALAVDTLVELAMEGENK